MTLIQNIEVDGVVAIKLEKLIFVIVSWVAKCVGTGL